MKSEKGITLTSLIIYVIAMVITITIITVVTSYFYKNVDVTDNSYDYLKEFTKLETYFSEEANKNRNQILEISPLENQSSANEVFVMLSSGNQYTFIRANKAIYQNNVKIGNNIKNCEISEEMKNGNQILVIKIQLNDKNNTERTMKYTLKNW